MLLTTVLDMIKYSGYSNLVTLNQSGVFALVHVRTKSMYLSYSNNILVAVGQHLSKASTGTHDNSFLNKHYSNLRLYIVELCDSNIVREQYSYWYNKLQPLYNKVPPPQYRVRIEVDHKYQILVKLVSKSGKHLVIGVFDKMEDAKMFKAVVQSQEHIRPLYASNELTRKYMEVQ